jgi:hypothetical protein
MGEGDAAPPRSASASRAALTFSSSLVSPGAKASAPRHREGSPRAPSIKQRK